MLTNKDKLKIRIAVDEAFYNLRDISAMVGETQGPSIYMPDICDDVLWHTIRINESIEALYSLVASNKSRQVAAEEYDVIYNIATDVCETLLRLRYQLPGNYNSRDVLMHYVNALEDQFARLITRGYCFAGE